MSIISTTPIITISETRTPSRMDNQTHTYLLNEYEILNLLHHRSKNQHHQQHWFKYLNIIYRNLRKLLKVQIDINRLATATTTSKHHAKIEHKQKQIVQISNKIIQVSRSAYWSYNSILVLGQYITLGFALIGNLAKIVNLVQNIDGVNVKHVSFVPAAVSADSNLDNLGNLFNGEVVNEDDLDDLGEEIAYDDEENGNEATPDVEENVGAHIEEANPQNRELDGVSAKTMSPRIDNEKNVQPLKLDSTSLEQPSKSKPKKEPTSKDTIDDIFGISSKKKKRKADQSKSLKPSKKSKSFKKSKSVIDDIFA